MLKVKYMLGDKIVCVESFYDDDSRLIRVNDTGYITEIFDEKQDSSLRDSVRAAFQIPELPHTTSVIVSTAKIDPSR